MSKALRVLIMLLLVLLVAGAVAGGAAGAGGGVSALIKDASDGVVDGTYSAATVRSALAAVRSDPAYTMYSDIEGVLVDYLASITGSGGTPKPSSTGTPHPSTTTSSGGTASPSPSAKPGGSSTGAQTPSPGSSGASTAATALPSTDYPSAGWDKAKSRMAAVPWLLALVAVGVVVGVVLYRRRRSS